MYRNAQIIVLLITLCVIEQVTLPLYPDVILSRLFAMQYVKRARTF
jgi:hypothetical protein